jgi:tryptophan 2-monooxygenase
MGLHTGIDKYIDSVRNDIHGSTDSGWKFQFPNTADFNFNYYKLLSDAEQSSIGQNRQPSQRVAIIGAGLAGLTVARELFRCGYTAVDLYEASDRIGGRTYSIPVQDEDNHHTVFEMGAMRIPFFSDPGSRNSVVDYYSTLFGLSTQPFPDPGSRIADTGIFLNNGYGPDADHPYARPTLSVWKKTQKKPPHRLFNQVYKKWSHFADLVKQESSKHYGSKDWTSFWHDLVQHYWDKNFRELVYMSAIDRYNPAKRGYFGGLNMTEEEANLFYTIGAGDGSWGAFYDISSLYPIRTLLFGFGTNHQLIQGRFNLEKSFTPGQQYGKRTEDSLGNSLEPPHYLGIQSLAECLFYQPVTSKWVEPLSLYEATKLNKYDVHLYTRNPVTKLKRLDSGAIEVTSGQLSEPKIYDQVILTVPAWALQLSTEFEGFDSQTQLPFSVINSLKVSHWISSCKVFYPLKERYWGEGKRIPQLISTDTYLQGVYGYAVEDEPGVLLVSYTWEDDANKLIASEQEDTSLEAANQRLAQKCLDKLDRILLNCHNIKTPISPYVDTSRPTIIHWSRKPSYRGCAKLYRETTWNTDYALLRYNQDYSAHSNLYFAGEAFSVEGGWIEPALRSALDAVIHVIKNTEGTFPNTFKYADYPQYDHWHPALESEKM